MTNPQIPPDGFRWVDPAAGQAAPTGTPAPLRPGEVPDSAGAPRRRWIVASVAAVVVLVAGLVVVMIWHPWSGAGANTPDAQTARPHEWPVGTPKDLMVPFSLIRQPLPGWRVSAADIGLPPRVRVGDLFASSGAKAYFVATHCDDDPCSHPMGWVYGLDTGSGRRLFPPVPMDGFYGGATDCYGNGPSVALCVTEGYRQDRPQLVWVIDVERGAVTYTGPTELSAQGQFSTGPRLRAVGNDRGETRLVATVDNKGVYGVGPHAELTWFLPGSGDVPIPNYLADGDIPPMTLALQRRNRSDQTGPRDRVFSVADGKLLPPTAPGGTTLDLAAVYNGGFTYQYQQGTSGGVLFFDSAGREVARQEIGFAQPMENAALPIFVINPQSKPEWLVYTGGGKLLARLPGDTIAAEFQTIGTKLYVKKSPIGPDESWQQWDLLTGNPGPICTMHLGGAYIASDGNVIVSQDTAKIVAIDPSTCQTLWETPSEPDNDRVVMWRVSGGLLGRTRRSDSVTSLGPAA